MVAVHIPTNLADLATAVTTYLHGTIDDVTPIQRKVAHRMFRALWHSPDGLQPIIIRFYQSTRCDEEARTEAAALRELTRMGYPVPEVFCCIDDAKVVGSPFIVMQHLKGQSLGELALQQPEQIPYWIEQASSLLARLHNLPWQNGFDVFQPPMDTLDFAERQVKWWAREALKVDATVASPGFTWLRENMYRARECAEKSLVHRDFHPNNLMVDGALFTGVLDWGEICIADPAIDIAWSRMVLATEVSVQFADSFTQAYCKRNPKVQATQQFWEVFAACKRLTIMAHIRKALDVTNTTPQESNLPVVQQTTWNAVIDFMMTRLDEED